MLNILILLAMCVWAFVGIFVLLSHELNVTGELFLPELIGCTILGTILGPISILMVLCMKYKDVCIYKKKKEK
jgi:hypothetical protein